MCSCFFYKTDLLENHLIFPREKTFKPLFFLLIFWICFQNQALFGQGRPVDPQVTFENSFRSTDRFGSASTGNSWKLPQYSTKKPLFSVATQDIFWRIPGSTSTVFAQVYFPMEVKERCPIVIYSHGLGGSPEQYSYLGKMWASRGLVCFFLDHPGSDSTVWKGKVRPIAELKKAYQRCWNGRDRALAIRFTIDRLFEIAKSDEPLGKLLDTNRIGLAGNDLGALAVLLVAGQLPPDNGPALKDDRVKAVLALSPSIYCSAATARLVYSPIEIPFMSFCGTEDDGLIGKTKSFQRRLPFDSLQGDNRYHVTLHGADHQIYGGHQILTRTRNDGNYQRVVMNVSMVFWGAYLLEDRDANVLLERRCPELLSRFGVLERKLH